MEDLYRLLAVFVHGPDLDDRELVPAPADIDRACVACGVDVACF